MAVTITSQPTTPILARKRQQWVIASTNYEALNRYRVEFVIPQEGDLPDIVIIQVPDTNGRTYFELSEVLDALLAHQLPSEFRYAVENEAFKTIQANIIERWNDGTEQSATTPITFDSIKAGVGHRAQAFDFKEYFKDKFLSYTGNGLKATKNSPLYLCFLFTNQTNTDGLAVEVIVDYTDGTSDTKSELVPIPSAFSEKMMLLNASYESLGLANEEQAGKEMIAYRVRLKVSDTNFQMQYFNVVLTTEKILKSFLFANSAGGWSTLHCFGNYEAENSFNMQVTEVNVPLNHAANVPQFKNFSPTLTESFKTSTGYLEKDSDETRHCDEFLLSRYRFEVTAEGQFLPIVIDNAKYKPDQSQPGLLALQFTYRYAFNNEVFDKV